MYHPTPGNILVQRDTPEEVSPGGIILCLDKTKTDKANTGVIIRTGDPRNSRSGISGIFAAGDRIVFKRYAGTDLGSENYVILAYEDVLAGIY